MLDYVTTAEKAKEWGISQRRVDVYCKEGRIEGAEILGRNWVIPKNAKKPTDPRKERKANKKTK